MSSRRVELVQGGQGFLVYAPVHVDGRFEGFVLGVYRIEELFGSVLHKVEPEVSVVVSDQASELYRREVDSPGRAEWLARSRDCRIQNLRWRVAVQPGRSFESVHLTRLSPSPTIRWAVCERSRSISGSVI